MSIRAAVVSLVLSLAATGPAWAQAVMDLPPHEDRALWLEAWNEVGQDAQAPAGIPAFTISAEAEVWSLSVRDSQGTLRTVGIQQPNSHTERVDVIFLAISLARKRDDWGWSAVPSAASPEELPEPEEPAEEPSPPEPETSPPPAEPERTRPARSFVSANSSTSPSPDTVSAPLPEQPPPPAPEIAAPGPEPEATTSPEVPANSLEPEPLDPIFPEPRDPIPILDEPKREAWPSWLWLQAGAGPTWRPETTVAWEGSLRGGWTGQRLRFGAGLRATTPTTLTAFHPSAERTVWDLDLLAGPWFPIGSRVDVGVEGGASLRRYHMQSRFEQADVKPVAAVELALRLPLRELKMGPYLRGTTDLSSTDLLNGQGDDDPVALQLWCLSLGIQAGGMGTP